jgi:uncharacterized lipoprotein YmbA
MHARVRPPRTAFAAALLIALSLQSGCSVLLGSRSDPPRLYVLTAAPPATAAPAIGRDLALGVGPISLPGYLDRRGLVTRVEANRVESARNDLWAEPVGSGFKSVLEEDLRLRLPDTALRAFPWPQNATPDLAVAVDVTRFEATGTGSVELRARWSVRRPGERAVLVERDSAVVLPIAGSGGDAMVAALSEALGRLADEIAAEVASRAPR